MGKNTKIEWVDHTANLWWGCEKVSHGCKNRYAETLSKRWCNDVFGSYKPRKEIKSVWNDLLKYQKLAEKANEIHTVFVGSMMDVFEKPMPIVGAAIDTYNTGVLRDRLFDQISEGWYPNFMFLLLTKRPENIVKMIPRSWTGAETPSNVWFGASISNEKNMTNLFHSGFYKLGKQGFKLFLSIEPQLESVHVQVYPKVDGVIQGGESGSGKRPFNLDWAYEMKENCKINNTPYFFKQIDKVKPIPEDLMVREFPIEFGKNQAPFFLED